MTALQTPLQPHILVADDNKIVRKLTGDLLRSCGAIPYLAEDGREALEMIRRQAFGLVLLDLRMPHLGGLEVARAVRAAPEIYGTPPLIGLSASDDSTLKTTCLETGMDFFLCKPLSRKRMRELILAWCPQPIGSERLCE